VTLADVLEVNAEFTESFPRSNGRRAMGVRSESILVL
jgi:hypothetical protein